MAHDTSILQWNCRGLRANLPDLQILIQKFSPKIICLQETKLVDPNCISIRPYLHLSKPAVASNTLPSGGVSILIHNSISYSPIPISSKIPAVAARVSLHTPISICTLYLHPNIQYTSQDLSDLVNQLPPPVVLLGDFNAHSPCWGDVNLDSRGKEVENFIMHANLCLLNSGSPTYYHPAHATHTAIDLTLTSPSLLQDLQWTSTEDPLGSDHIPILIQGINHSPNSTTTFYWNFRRADWTLYRNLCEEKITANILSCDGDCIEEMSNIIYEIAKECIPAKKPNPKKTDKPWFNQTCRDQIKTRKLAFKAMNKSTNPTSINNYRIEKAKTRKIIKDCKRTSWKEYVSKISPRTSCKKVWNMIRKISGKSIHPPSSHLIKGNQTITEPQEIADILADTFSHNSSTEHYSSSFQAYKQQEEINPPDFTSTNQENYNSPFSADELNNAIEQAKDTAAGPDCIHYQLIRNLPSTAKLLLLQTFNNMWECDRFPPIWRQAIVLPIPKPGKTHTDPTNYRPISLTSCLCKTFERMLNNRLIWILESQNILSNIQCGFRKNRSTVDHLIRLETYIRKKFLKQHHVVAIFFDLEKAYDTVWNHGILTDIHKIGLRGHLPLFIKNFLYDRQFQVRTNCALSSPHRQETGVPQGSILSVTLFALRINEITKLLSSDTEASLFVDDLTIYYSGRQLESVIRHLQTDVNQLVRWCDKNGFKFSPSKTTCVHFTTKRHTPEPILFINNSPIPVANEAKFLGITFDRKLTFRSHISQLKTKCLKASNIIKVISHYDWGGDQDSLLSIYRALIRSRIDYGSIVYGSARPYLIKQLDTIANQALRLCLGAFRTSPVSSLQIEAHEPPLSLRREKLSLQYATKMSANPTNPAFKDVFSASPNPSSTQRRKAILPFSNRISADISTIIPPNTEVMVNTPPSTPPWLRMRPKIILKLHSDEPKNPTNYHVLKIKYHEVRSSYPDYEAVFTDGSRINNSTASACIILNHTLMKKLPDHFSVFSAELHAISMSLSHIQQYTQHRYIIFTDSLSSLQAINSYYPQNPLVTNIQNQLHHLLLITDILFCWIPSHIGIAGNELADKAAKMALTTPTADTPVSSSDLRQHVNALIINKWQKLWDQENNNKLHTIQPTITRRIPNIHQLSRRERSVITRLRIGHSFVTHSYILKKEEKPFCIPCNELLTTEHILLHCTDYSDIRTKHFNCSSIQELFSTTNPINIIRFLKEIRLYSKI